MYDEAVRSTRRSRSGVSAEGIGKRFGDMWALRDLELEVEPGSVLGLLGHNGAGKSTALRILTTLTTPTVGSASVAGHDVVAAATEVRRRIGVASQAATVDGLMSGRLNLEITAGLYGFSRHDARRRASELLERVDLMGAADSLVASYSGGMRRRLDLAASIVADPEVIFLDEPTTGLDPRSRGDLWEMLRELVADGTTLVLTTQYLEEADRLADEIVVLDHGRVVAKGTPSALKDRIGGQRIDIEVDDAAVVDQVIGALVGRTSGRPTYNSDLGVVSAPVREGVRLVDVVRALDDARIRIGEVTPRRASLDDVFFTLTSNGGPR
jgi:ABC-2 type transport system ATP-binding protein